MTFSHNARLSVKDRELLLLTIVTSANLVIFIFTISTSHRNAVQLEKNISSYLKVVPENFVQKRPT